jgi:uracil-DNA glycosylase family 4
MDRNSKFEKLRQLHFDVQKCAKCHEMPNGTITPDPKKVERKSFKESLDSKIFIVGQSLASDQVRLTGVPFHKEQDGKMNLSRGGKFLEQFLNEIQYTLVLSDKDKKYVYTTDLVKCFPGKKAKGNGDRIPKSPEKELCKDWLLKELEILEPRVILLFGNLATEAFFKYILKRADSPKMRDLYSKPHHAEVENINISIFVLPHFSSMVEQKSEIYKASFKAIKEEISNNGRGI